ncbi:MAG: hypothetical protein H0U23_15215 [Blastocatellia bacterium]|nr:hypothetical protein [Blastocatellia bacterium]
MKPNYCSPAHRATGDPASRAFLNRDHIVLALWQGDGVALTTTLGTQFFVSGPPDILETFMDQLLNASGSNFVAIPGSQS